MRRSWAMMAVSCFAVTACSARTVDTWYAHRPDGMDIVEEAGWRPVPKDRVYEVTAPFLEEAARSLSTSPLMDLEPSSVERLIGRKPADSSGKPFLVRALALQRGTGAFRLWSKGPVLCVTHGSLGHYTPPAERQPLVVYLEAKPTTVYVETSMAE